MNHNCPECGYDLTHQRTARALFNLRCPECQTKLTLNLHPSSEVQGHHTTGVISLGIYLLLYWVLFCFGFRASLFEPPLSYVFWVFLYLNHLIFSREKKHDVPKDWPRYQRNTPEVQNKNLTGLFIPVMFIFGVYVFLFVLPKHGMLYLHVAASLFVVYWCIKRCLKPKPNPPQPSEQQHDP